ncbi:MAG: HAD-IA family hydrolase [Oscillospiraceae bacterium]
MNLKAVLFDLDGTLIYTLQDLADCTNHILKNHNFPSCTVKQVEGYVGNGIKKLIERAVPKGTSDNIIDICYEEMLIYYNKHSLDKTKPYDGILGFIDTLKNSGLKLAVITNKAEDSAEKIVHHFFGDKFDLIVGDNKKDKLKPAPDNVYRAVKHFGLSLEEVMYVGDSFVDVETGFNSKVDMATVLWGYNDKETLLKHNAINLVATTKELEEYIFSKI